MIKYLIGCHKFFIGESPSFMKATNRIKYYLRYPIAYIKFMYYAIKDYQPKTNPPCKEKEPSL